MACLMCAACYSQNPSWNAIRGGSLNQWERRRKWRLHSPTLCHLQTWQKIHSQKTVIFTITNVRTANYALNKMEPSFRTNVNTPTPRFGHVCFTPLSFNATCKFTTLLNIHSLIFGWTPFGWLRSITVTPCFWWEYYFWFMPTCQGTQTGRKARFGCNSMSHEFCPQLI